MLGRPNSTECDATALGVSCHAQQGLQGLCLPKGANGSHRLGPAGGASHQSHTEKGSQYVEQ